jgi:hypothetical protein
VNQYPEAGIPGQAPPEVVEAVERFRDLPAPTRARIPLLYWLLGSGTPPYKMSQESVDYGAPPADQRGHICGNCRFGYARLINGQLLCSQMEGEITWDAWCRLHRFGEGKQKPRSWRTRLRRLLTQRK